MKNAKQIDKSNIECPKCLKPYPINEYNLSKADAPVGSGGCLIYGKCPHCDDVHCVKRDEPEPKLKPKHGSSGGYRL